MIKVYNENELQELLGINLTQSRLLMKDESFPSFRIGNTFGVEESELLDWIHTTKRISLAYPNGNKPRERETR